MADKNQPQTLGEAFGEFLKWVKENQDDPEKIRIAREEIGKLNATADPAESSNKTGKK